MQIIEVSKKSLKQELKVILPGKDIESKIQNRLEELVKTVNLPGFRPGKVPVKIIKARFGEAVQGEILEKEINDSFQKAVEDKGLRPAAQPDFDIKDYKEGEDFEFSFSFENLPTIDNIDLKKVKVSKYTAAASEKEINESLKSIAENRWEFEAIKEKRKSKEGDVVIIDFDGKLNGERFDGGKGEDFQLELGSKQMIPGFEEQIIGMKAGDKETIQVNFPEDYNAAELAGKEASFDINLKEIGKKAAAKLDDEFAKKMGQDSLDALKKDIKKHLEKEYESMSRHRIKTELLDELASDYKFDIPESMEDNEFKTIWSQLEEDKKNGRLEAEDQKKSEKELEKEYREIAARRVRLGLLLAEIGRQNKIEVSDKELNEALRAEASKYPGQEKLVYEFYKKNPDMLMNVRGPIYEDKVIDFILKQAEVKEIKVPAEKIMTEGKAEKKKPAAKTKATSKTDDKKESAKTTKKAAAPKAKKTAKSDVKKKPAPKAKAASKK